MKNIRFTNLVIDSTLLETVDIIHVILSFIKGKCNYSIVVDNKYNVKNNRYYLIRGSNMAMIRNYFINTDLL